MTIYDNNEDFKKKYDDCLKLDPDHDFIMWNALPPSVSRKLSVLKDEIKSLPNKKARIASCTVALEFMLTYLKADLYECEEVKEYD